jgi:hypothetical protein
MFTNINIVKRGVVRKNFFAGAGVSVSLLSPSLIKK